MAKKKVLLVDDNIDDIALTKRAFKSTQISHELHVCKDGAEAVEYLFHEGRFAPESSETLPDLILLDLKLPKINGVEVLRKIRNDPRTAFLLVVVLSTSLEERDIQECYNLNVNSYIRKPVDYDQFVDEIGHISYYWLGLNVSPMSKGEA